MKRRSHFLFAALVALSGIVSACTPSRSVPTPGTPSSPSPTPTASPGAQSGTFTLTLPAASNGAGGSIVLNASNPVNVTIATATASGLPALQAHRRTAQSVNCGTGSLVAGYTLTIAPVQTTNTSVAASVSSSGVTFSNLPLSLDLTTAQLEIFDQNTFIDQNGNFTHTPITLVVGPLTPTSTSGRSAYFEPPSAGYIWNTIVNDGANGVNEPAAV